MPIQFGDIFVWKNFPDHHDGVSKNAWFIILGKTGYGVEPEFSYLLRATTQLHYYETGGSRCKNLHVKIERKKAQYSFFEEDCLFDCDGTIFPRSENLNNLESEGIIVKKGKLDLVTISEIFSKLKSGRKISKIVLMDIKSQCHNNGVKT